MNHTVLMLVANPIGQLNSSIVDCTQLGSSNLVALCDKWLVHEVANRVRSLALSNLKQLFNQQVLQLVCFLLEIFIILV